MMFEMRKEEVWDELKQIWEDDLWRNQVSFSGLQTSTDVDASYLETKALVRASKTSPSSWDH